MDLQTDTNLVDDKPTLPEHPSQGDETLLLAFDAVGAADYVHGVSFVNGAIDQGISWKEGQAEAYNLRGTFKCVFEPRIREEADRNGPQILDWRFGWCEGRF
jgi:hypothetical protein